MTSLQFQMIACLMTAALAGICSCIAAVIFMRQMRRESNLNKVLNEAEASRLAKKAVKHAMAEFFEHQTESPRILTGAHARKDTFANGLRKRFDEQRNNNDAISP